jgi:hypothetical protein
MPQEQRAAALAQQTPCLHALATALVTRTQLSPAALCSATSDARDLPEEMRTVSGCVGWECALCMHAAGKRWCEAGLR